MKGIKMNEKTTQATDKKADEKRNAIVFGVVALAICLWFFSGDSAKLPKEQQAFIAKIELLQKELGDAEKTGNEIMVNSAKAKETAFTDNTKHYANGWRAKIEGVYHEETGGQVIYASDGKLDFRLHVVDPALVNWVSARKAEEEIEFSGDMGRMKKFFLSSKPLFSFYPTRIGVVNSATQSQDASLIASAMKEANDKAYKEKVSEEVTLACESEIRQKLKDPSAAQFSDKSVVLMKNGNFAYAAQFSAPAARGGGRAYGSVLCEIMRDKSHRHT
jgi:hypothetical protein